MQAYQVVAMIMALVVQGCASTQPTAGPALKTANTTTQPSAASQSSCAVVLKKVDFPSDCSGSNRAICATAFNTLKENSRDLEQSHSTCFAAAQRILDMPLLTKKR